jgi:hypothetical protein
MAKLSKNESLLSTDDDIRAMSTDKKMERLVHIHAEIKRTNEQKKDFSKACSEYTGELKAQEAEILKIVEEQNAK